MLEPGEVMSGPHARSAPRTRRLRLVRPRVTTPRPGTECPRRCRLRFTTAHRHPIRPRFSVSQGHTVLHKTASVLFTARRVLSRKTRSRPGPKPRAMTCRTESPLELGGHLRLHRRRKAPPVSPARPSRRALYSHRRALVPAATSRRHPRQSSSRPPIPDARARALNGHGPVPVDLPDGLHPRSVAKRTIILNEKEDRSRMKMPDAEKALKGKDRPPVSLGSPDALPRPYRRHRSLQPRRSHRAYSRQESAQPPSPGCAGRVFSSTRFRPPPLALASISGVIFRTNDGRSNRIARRTDHLRRPAGDPKAYAPSIPASRRQRRFTSTSSP